MQLSPCPMYKCNSSISSLFIIQFRLFVFLIDWDWVYMVCIEVARSIPLLLLLLVYKKAESQTAAFLFQPEANSRAMNKVSHIRQRINPFFIVTL